MPKFEAHITLPIERAFLAQKAAAATGWKYSAIDGEAMLESKPYCYLTNYDPDGPTLLAKMDVLCRSLEGLGVNILRRKVERIVFDSKTGVDELTALTARDVVAHA